ncbi:hypothetical protein GGP50_003158 [Salinibacter ruber]|nr:hypothetical protein [Salinibacter ruber]
MTISREFVNRQVQALLALYYNPERGPAYCQNRDILFIFEQAVWLDLPPHL